jgi:hypothetical protein
MGCMLCINGGVIQTGAVGNLESASIKVEKNFLLGLGGMKLPLIQAFSYKRIGMRYFCKEEKIFFVGKILGKG